MTHCRTDTSVDRGCIRSLAPAHTARRLVTVELRGRREGPAGGRGWTWQWASGGGQERAAEHERRRRRAVSRSLLSALVLCVRDEPPGSSPLRFEGAARDGEENGAAGEVEEGRNGQQGTRDDADAPSLVPLLTASVLHVRDEPPGSSLWSFEGVGRHGEANGGRGECKGSGGGRARHVGVVSLHSPRDEPPGSSLLCSEGAGKDEVVGRPRRASRTGQERAAGHEGRRGRTVARAPALRFRPACVRRASELVLVEFQGCGNDWEQAAEAKYALDVLQWVSTQAKRK